MYYHPFITRSLKKENFKKIFLCRLIFVKLLLIISSLAFAQSNGANSSEPKTSTSITTPSAIGTPQPAATVVSPATTTSPAKSTTPASPTTTAPSSEPSAPSTAASPPATTAIQPTLSLEQLYSGNAETGQTKSAVCAACHGPDGNSVTPIWPKIAGQGLEYLVMELMEYRRGPQGTRFDPSMFAMTQSLSDQDIADLAAYFASQKMSPGVAKADLVALGEKIYRGGNPDSGVPACAACHGAKGEGNTLARFPRLSGQHSDYTLDQLKKFKAKTRSDDPNEIMRDIAGRMTDDEMKAVSSYVSGLH